MKRTIIAVALALTLGTSLGGCATADIQTSLSIAEQGFTTAQVLYNSVCAVTTGVSFCSAADMLLANQAADAVRQAIEDYQNVLANKGSSQAQITAAVQGIVHAEQNFSNIVNSLQAKKAKAMARAAQ